MPRLPKEEVVRRKELFIAHFIRCFAEPALLPAASHVADRANTASAFLGVVGIAMTVAGGIAAPFTMGASLGLSVAGGIISVYALGPQGIKVLFKFLDREQKKIREGWTNTLLAVREYEVNSVLKETARQIARAYEYQICRLQDDNAIRQMAAAALALIFAGITKIAEETRDEFRLAFKPEILINIMLTSDCGRGQSLPTADNLDWHAFSVLSKPGLRVSLCDQSKHIITQEFFLRGSLTKLTYSDAKIKANKYGYRGRFNSNGTYIMDNEFKFSANLSELDKHKDYIPLVVETPKEVVLEYITAQRFGGAAANENLNSYISRIYAASYSEFNGFTLTAWCQDVFVAKADLNGGNFRETDFSGVTLPEAKLRNTMFRDAILVHACLRQADMTTACFAYADMKNVDLTGVQVGNTNFFKANLSWAHMRNIVLDPSNPTYMEEVTSYGINAEEDVLERMHGGKIIADMSRTIRELTQRVDALEGGKMSPITANKNFGECVSFYQPRDKVLNEISSKLTSSFQLAIVGVPGCGKTQLSLYYASCHYKAHPDSVVWILNAADAASLRHDYKDLAVKLGLSADIEDLTKIKSFVNSALDRTLDKFIIIFDNANDRTIVEQYLPTSTLYARGNIIVTTTKAADFTDFAVVDASGGFSEDEAINFLQGVAKSEEAKKLAIALQSLPLKLAAAKMYMQQCKISVKPYLELLKNEPEMIQIVESKIMHPFYDRSAGYDMTAINLAIRGLKEKHKERLLQYLSFFANKDIPVFLLHPIVEGAGLNSFLMGLDASFVTITGLDDHRRISMHSMMQIAYLSELDKVKGLKLLQQAISNVDKFFKRDNRTIELKNTNEELIPHAQALLNKAAKFDITAGSKTELLSLRLKTAVYYQFTGRNEEARTVLFEVIKNEIFSKLVDKNNLKVCCEVLAKTDPRLPTLYAATLYHLGRTYIYLKDYLEHEDESKGCLEKAVNLRQIIDENKQTTEPWNDVYNQDAMDSIIFKRSGIILLHSMLGENNAFSPEQRIRYLETAAADYEGLIQAEEKASVRDDFNFRTCCRESVGVYRKWAKVSSSEAERDRLYRKAKENLYKSLDAKFPDDTKGTNLVAKLQALPPSDIRRAKDYNACANLFLDIGEYTLAKELFKKAKEVEKQVGEAGKNFPLADAYYGLAKIYLKEKKLSPASNCIDRCLEIRRNMKDRTINLAEQLQQEIAQVKAPAPVPVPAGTLAKSMSGGALVGASTGNQLSDTNIVVAQPPSKP